jgi:hypothetical protein
VYGTSSIRGRIRLAPCSPAEECSGTAAWLQDLLRQSAGPGMNIFRRFEREVGKQFTPIKPRQTTYYLHRPRCAGIAPVWHSLHGKHSLSCCARCEIAGPEGPEARGEEACEQVAVNLDKVAGNFARVAANFSLLAASGERCPPAASISCKRTRCRFRSSGGQMSYGRRRLCKTRQLFCKLAFLAKLPAACPRARPDGFGRAPTSLVRSRAQFRSRSTAREALC